MTLVHIDLRRGNFSEPTLGFVSVAPTRRLHINTTPDYIVLPDAVSYELTDGQADIELAPSSTPNWAWSITEHVRAGQRWGNGINTNISWGEGVENGTVDIDKTISGTIATSATRTYGPLAILGTSTTSKSVTAFVGDSIASGYDDVASDAGEMGFLARKFTAQSMPYVNLAISGESTGRWGIYPDIRRRSPMLEYADSVIVELGVNDLPDLPTLAALNQVRINNWLMFAKRGLRVYQTTITPRVLTSTDSWATLGGQSFVPAEEALRLATNAWIRDGAPMIGTAPALTGSNAAGTIRIGQHGHPVLAYFEVADVCESARNSGLWKVTGVANGYTDDGIHPKSFVHTLMGDVIDTALIEANAHTKFPTV